MFVEPVLGQQPGNARLLGQPAHAPDDGLAGRCLGGIVTRPAFQLYAEIDIPILAVGTVFALARRTKTQPAFCAPTCNSGSLNALDKLTAGYYSAGWSTSCARWTGRDPTGIRQQARRRLPT